MSSDETVAYQRPRSRRINWRIRTEHAITRIRDWYDTLWDVMPAIAAFTFLLWLINLFSR